jgi:hypothetical protein
VILSFKFIRLDIDLRAWLTAYQELLQVDSELLANQSVLVELKYIFYLQLAIFFKNGPQTLLTQLVLSYIGGPVVMI